MGAPARVAPRRVPVRPKPKPARAKPIGRRRSRAVSSGNVVMMPVNAVGRTAVAVGGIADSGVVVGMSKSRVWIAVMGLLLGGIVAVNVVGLSLSASGSQTSAKVDELIRDNSVLGSRIAQRLSNARITSQATALGLAIPAPDAVQYLKSSAVDAKRAAERLADGSITNAPPVLAQSEADVVGPSVVPADPAVVADPATVVAADPAATTVTAPAAIPEAIP